MIGKLRLPDLNQITFCWYRFFEGSFTTTLIVGMKYCVVIYGALHFACAPHGEGIFYLHETIYLCVAAHGNTLLVNYESNQNLLWLHFHNVYLFNQKI